MEQKVQIVKFCQELGCCDACCLRYLGLKHPEVYENTHKSILKYQEQPENVKTDSETVETTDVKRIETTDVKRETEEKTPEKNGTKATEDETESTRATEDNGDTLMPAKRRRLDICVSCLGVLQEQTWPESFKMVKEQLDKKGYDCKTFGCALSAPIATMLREKVVTLRLKEAFPSFDIKTVTPLKEAWKWSFGCSLADHISMRLDSGAVSPLLITLTMEYADEMQELELLKTLSPSLFESRSKQRRRFTVEFTRRSVEQALCDVTAASVTQAGWQVTPREVVKCGGVACVHCPAYLGGRYIKLSRELPQTPWVVSGQRMMESSVQEIIMQPIAELYGMSAEESESRLKFMSAGREDVDVRCLGDGRPFAVEVSDPNRQLTAEELQRACEQISKGGKVIVKQLVHVSKEDLTLLKQGEETKTKMYEALCIKLSHGKDDDPSGPVAVTERDISAINTYRNAPEGVQAAMQLQQRTPIRVLHRRPLLTRTRLIYEMHAELVPEHPQLLMVRLVTQAGTYVKEWAHGSLRRTRPALPDVIGARSDILALDVTAVHLHWPGINNT